MLGRLTGLFTGPVLRALGAQLTDALRVYENAQTSEAQSEAQVRVQQLQAMIAAQHEMNAANKVARGYWEIRGPVALAALGPCLHYFCVCLVSTFPGLFPGWVVVKLPPPMDEWESTIILSFFGVMAGAQTLPRLISIWRGK